MSRRRPLLVALRALKLGDLLTGLPALRALRRAFPEHHTVLLAPGWLSHLALHSGAADELVPHPGLVPLPRCTHGADVAVDLHGKGPGSQPLLLGSRPRRLMCFAHPEVPGTEHGARWLPVEHETARWCRMLSHYGVAADPRDLDIELPALRAGALGGAWERAHLPEGDAPGLPAGTALTATTVVHPGAASGARRWPAARFGAVARHEMAKGRPVLVSAGPGERPLAEQVVEQAGGPAGILDNLSLLDLAAVLGRAGRLVSGDTGVSHLATALRVPSVVLCGPVPPQLWGPPADRPWHVALWAGRDGDPHGSQLDPGLAEIGVEDVTEALDRLPAPSLVRAAGRGTVLQGEPAARSAGALEDIEERMAT